MSENEKRICAGCGAYLEKNNYYFLNDRKEGAVCRECEKTLRFKYPVRAEKNPDCRISINPHDDSSAPLYTDVYPVLDLTAQQLRQELASADACREQLRISFAGAENVFEVRQVRPLPKLNPFRVNIQNAIRFKNAVAVYGVVRLGTFHKGDIAQLRSDGISHDTTVLFIRRSVIPENEDPLSSYINPDTDRLFNSDRKGISEGLPAIMMLPYESAGVKPGDLIVVD